LNSSFVLSSPGMDTELHTISSRDLEDLRMWKNLNRERFFYKGIITPEQQLQWYDGYLSRQNDMMFVVQKKSLRLGCVGIRSVRDIMDIYNLMRWFDKHRPGGEMGHAVRIMCSYVRRFLEYTGPIRAQVIMNNADALDWYEKNRFFLVNTGDGYVDVEWRGEECPVTYSLVGANP
jgi:hypothetical protein